MSILNSFFKLKTILYVFFFVLFVWIGYYLFLHIKNTHGFILGDWLVNYHDGGFKRRGLSGSMFFIIQDITGLKLKTLVYSVQMILYCIFFILIIKILQKKTVSLLFLTLVLSPLTFVFFFNDINIIGRKEILVYVIFAYFLYLKMNNRFSGYREYVIYMLLILGTLLHEIFIFYISYFIIVLLVFNKKINIKQSLLLFLSVFIPTVIIFFFGGLTNEGESFILLSERGVNFSTNKLNIFDFSNALLSSLDKYKSSPINYSLYLLSLLLGIFHFSFYLRTEAKTDFKILISYFLLAIIYSLPLFVLVCDWGRWLQIHFTLLFLIILARRSSENKISIQNKIFCFNIKNILLLIIITPFFFTWRIYHFKWGFKLDGMLYFIYKKAIALF